MKESTRLAGELTGLKAGIKHSLMDHFTVIDEIKKFKVPVKAELGHKVMIITGMGIIGTKGKLFLIDYDNEKWHIDDFPDLETLILILSILEKRTYDITTYKGQG